MRNAENHQGEHPVVICPNCGTEIPGCVTIDNDRAGDTSQRCGKTPAIVFDRFNPPVDTPRVLTTTDLAARLYMKRTRKQ